MEGNQKRGLLTRMTQGSTENSVWCRQRYEIQKERHRMNFFLSQGFEFLRNTIQEK